MSKDAKLVLTAVVCLEDKVSAGDGGWLTISEDTGKAEHKSGVVAGKLAEDVAGKHAERTQVCTRNLPMDQELPRENCEPSLRTRV